jgi:opacity protein-like surface antigen
MRGRSIAGALLAVLISSSASAQQVRWSFKLGGGLAIPTGTYNRTVEFNGATALVPIDDPWWSGTDIPAGSALNSYSKNSFGLNAGAGLAYTLAKDGAVFLEGRYHHAFADPVDSQVLPIVVGVTFGF